MGKVKKVFGVTKQIVRWVWRVILSLLLILCIIFQAPLKLLALLAIFLLACTALPPRWRKWFWATVGIVILGLVVWVFIPENDKDWKSFTFDDELAALEAKYKAPEKENAAVIYNQLIADYNKSDLEPNCLNDNFVDCETMGTFWRSKDYPEVAKWIKSNKQTINKLIQASEFERCKFEVTSKSLLIPETDRFGAFRRWTMLLSRAGNNDIAEGRTDEGLKKYYCILQIDKHLCQQSSLIELLVGIAIEAVGIDRLENFIIAGNPNKKQLDAIEKMINEVKYDWQSDWPRTLDYEKLFMKNFCGISYEVNLKGQFRFTRDPSKMMRTWMPNESNKISSLSYFQKKLIKAGSIICWFSVPSTPQELSRTIDVAYQKFYKMADPNFDWSRKPKSTEFPMSPMSSFILEYKLNYKYIIKMLVDMEESSYYTIHNYIYLRGESSKRGALLLVALRRYKDKNGNWPENLDEIADLTDVDNFIDPVKSAISSKFSGQ